MLFWRQGSVPARVDVRRGPPYNNPEKQENNGQGNKGPGRAK